MNSDQSQIAPRFAELLEFHLNLRLQKFAAVGKNLSHELMEEMYALIRDTVHLVFSKSSRNLSEVTKDWISQKYYESIKLSSSKIIIDDPESWECRTSKVYTPIQISKIPVDDLRYIAKFFNETVFAKELDSEIQNR